MDNAPPKIYLQRDQKGLVLEDVDTVTWKWCTVKRLTNSDVEYEIKSNWNCVDHFKPEEGVEVMGYSEEWVDEDFNPDGTMVCIWSNYEWIVSVWLEAVQEYKTSYNVHIPTHWIYKPKYSKP